jgi:hypothetical protein
VEAMVKAAGQDSTNPNETNNTADHSEDDNLSVTRIVKAYVFGDRFLAANFQVAMFDQLIEQVNSFPVPNWSYATLYALNNLPEGSPMLEVLDPCYYHEHSAHEQLTACSKRRQGKG